jgi:hypothetical protein
MLMLLTKRPTAEAWELAGSRGLGKHLQHRAPIRSLIRHRHLRARALHSRLDRRDLHPRRHAGKDAGGVAGLRSSQDFYKDVPESKLLAHNGNDFKYYRLRVLHNGPINGVFRTEFDAHYQQIDATRWVCQTRTTRVTEIEDYGKPKAARAAAGTWQRLSVAAERLLAPGTARWRRLPGVRNRFADARPAADIGALFVSSTHTIEREGLTATLQATRDAAKK